MIFASILLILFQQSFCQRVVQQELTSELKKMCPMNKSEAAINEFFQASNTKIEALEKKVSNIMDVLASIKLVVGYSMCRSGYEYYREDNFCYKFHSECKSWSDARQICQQEGGDLISLKESNLNYFRSVVKQQTGACNGAWVGATDNNSIGKWSWLNGVRITYVFWYPEQPDNWAGKEHCGDMKNNYDFFMNDESCDTALHFLCQIPIL